MTNEEIDVLFSNEHFKEKLVDFIVDNLKIHHRYDAYLGEYDDMTFSICGQYLDIDESYYGF